VTFFSVSAADIVRYDVAAFAVPWEDVGRPSGQCSIIVLAGHLRCVPLSPIGIPDFVARDVYVLKTSEAGSLEAEGANARD